MAALATLSSCAWPTHNQATLRAIKAESETLIATFPDKNARTSNHVIVPKNKWPPTIASLKPEFVTVDADGVDIMTKPFFDGGYGYFVPGTNGRLPGPKERYSDLGHGVYWYRPY